MGMNEKRVPWYALRVRKGFERVVLNNLSRRGFEVFMPSSTSRRRADNKRLQAPLFPGYLFCRANPAGKRSVLNTPGVLYIAGNANARGCVVDEIEIAAVKTVVQSPLSCQSSLLLDTGPRVRVAGGPLRNLEGVFVDKGSRYRIAISLSLLQRSVLVDLPKGTRVEYLSDNRMAIQVPA